MAKYVQLTKDDIEALLGLSALPDKLRKKFEGELKGIKRRTAKAKGMALQIDTCNWISEITGIPYTKDDDSLIVSRPSGCNNTDIILRGDAKKLFPFSVECKNVENLNIVDAIEQAKANVLPGTDWLVLHRRKALKEDIVIVSKETFGKIIDDWISYHNP